MYVAVIVDLWIFSDDSKLTFPFSFVLYIVKFNQAKHVFLYICMYHFFCFVVFISFLNFFFDTSDHQS